MKEGAAIAQALSELIPALKFSLEPDVLETHGGDWTHFTPRKASIVLFPQSIAEVQSIMRFAHEHSIAVVPSGGRTGLSGGAVAYQGEMVLSFDKMNQILGFEPVEGLVTCQAGVITQTLQEYAENQGLFYPVSFASRGSSQIGGNVATNAGGIKVLRYGMTRQWVAGLKVVTATGELLNLNRNLIKDASGYDLRQLFIGSEGTLGVIVEVTLRLTTPPPEQRVLLLALPDFAKVNDLLSQLRQHVTLSAFEFFTDNALNHVLRKQGLSFPINEHAGFYVLAEFDAKDEGAALNCFESALEKGWVNDGVLSQSETQAQELWRLREDITESIAEFHTFKNDISVPVAKIPAFLAKLNQTLGHDYPDYEVVWFGHIADGNLHVGILKPHAVDKSVFVEHCKQMSDHVYSEVACFGGSISAEHGIGLLKKPYLHHTHDEKMLSYMKELKSVFDGTGILNPGKIFDQD